MASPMASTSRIVLAGPSNLLRSGNSQQTFLLLPHPRTSLPTYFLPGKAPQDATDADQAEMYELQAVKSDKKSRSWMLNARQKAAKQEEQPPIPESQAEDSDPYGDGKGYVLQDPSLQILSPIDPTFLLLPLLQVLLDSPTSTAFLPMDDLLESMATLSYARLAKAHNELAAKTAKSQGPARIESLSVPEQGDSTSWPDILVFGSLPCFEESVKKLCEVQTITEDLAAYRPSTLKISQFLAGKLSKLAAVETFERFPDTLGKALDRTVDFNPATLNGGAANNQRSGGSGEARVKITAQLVEAYVPREGKMKDLWEEVKWEESERASTEI